MKKWYISKEIRQYIKTNFREDSANWLISSEKIKI